MGEYLPVGLYKACRCAMELITNGVYPGVAISIAGEEFGFCPGDISYGLTVLRERKKGSKRMIKETQADRKSPPVKERAHEKNINPGVSAPVNEIVTHAAGEKKDLSLKPEAEGIRGKKNKQNEQKTLFNVEPINQFEYEASRKAVGI